MNLDGRHGKSTTGVNKDTQHLRLEMGCFALSSIITQLPCFPGRELACPYEKLQEALGCNRFSTGLNTVKSWYVII